MFKENLKTFRKNKGLSQEALAEKLNIVRQTVSKWEKGYSVPDADMLKKTAELLDVSISELLGDETINETNIDKITETLTNINAELAIKNSRANWLWKTVGVVSIFVITIALVVFATYLIMNSYYEKIMPKEKESIPLLELIYDDEDISPNAMYTSIRVIPCYYDMDTDEYILVIEDGMDWSASVWYVQYDGYEILNKKLIDEACGNVLSCEIVEMFDDYYIEIYSATHMGNGSTILWNTSMQDVAYKFGSTIDSHHEGWVSEKDAIKYELPYVEEEHICYGYSHLFEGGKLSSQYVDINNDGYEDAIFEGVMKIVSDDEYSDNVDLDVIKYFEVKRVYLYNVEKDKFKYNKEMSYERELD